MLINRQFKKALIKDLGYDSSDAKKRVLKSVKDFNKGGQKLPLFGIGPYMIFGMGLTTLAGIILFGYVL